MGQLIIIDYSDASAHIYNVDSQADIDEYYIETLGYNINQCYWMFSQDGIEITFHKEILK